MQNYSTQTVHYGNRHKESQSTVGKLQLAFYMGNWALGREEWKIDIFLKE